MGVPVVYERHRGRLKRSRLPVCVAFSEYQPSSPAIALLKDGETVFILQRHQIEGRDAKDIADDVIRAFDKYCSE